MKHFSHLNTAASITGMYTGQQPFHLFIKNFFGQHKKYGSKDRKQITQLCYCYYRMGAAARNKPVAAAITEALFLCSDQPNDTLAALQPAWNDQVKASLEEKCALLGIAPGTLTIFPWPEELSSSIDKTAFNLSHLQQPAVFIRVRPGQLAAVTAVLEKTGIPFLRSNDNCISLPPAVKAAELFKINREVVIQDYSSQRTGDFMQLIAAKGTPIKTWDCCAASGGKSIMAKDILGDMDLTVSDIRPSVLASLQTRFSEAGISRYTLLPADLSRPLSGIAAGSFQFIIADVPCSGSGTWSRAPENLSFFAKKEIDHYVQLQQKIVTTAMQALAKNGYFLYITCSVFKKENEDMVSFMKDNFPVEIIKMELLQGYAVKADTLFAALLRYSN